MWVFFMDEEHQNNVICTFRHPFWVYGSGLLTNCFRTRNGSSPRKCECPYFDLKYLLFKKFPQQNWLYRLKEYILDNLEKILFDE